MPAVTGSGTVDCVAPLLRIRGMHKRFPGVHALKGVDLDVRPGEVHALVGENGAGKSTLMHILAGVYRPDAGAIEWQGLPVQIADERHAQALGIAIVFQERSLFGPLSIADNVFAGRQPVAAGAFVDRRKRDEETRLLLDQLGMKLDPRTRVEDISPGAQQMVEIAKALSLDARLLILDEPTAALTPADSQRLFAAMRRLRERGVAVVYISHRLEEVFALADRVTILRDGTLQGTCATSEISADELIRRMVGRQLASRHVERPNQSADVPPVLEVRRLCDRADASAHGPLLRDIGFTVRRGEIVALAGLGGAGRTELALSIFGARPRASGEVLVDGRRVSVRSPADAVAAGIGYLPEDRKDAGLFLEMSIARNVVATQISRRGSLWLNNRSLARAAGPFCDRLRIACRDVAQPVEELSGGNQQKVILARWLSIEPRVLLVDEPTRGVDVGAKREVHDLLFELADRGTAVVAISSDLPEVLELADRVVVLCEGRITRTLSRGEATEESILRAASPTS